MGRKGLLGAFTFAMLGLIGCWNAAETEIQLPAPADFTTLALSSTTIRISWSPVVGAEGYDLYRSSSESGLFSMINAVVIIDSHYDDTGLVANTMYWYKVAAVRDGREHTQSTAFSANTPPPPGPVNPTPPSGGLTTGTTPLLVWENVANAAEYQVQVNTGSDFAGTVIVDDTGVSVSQFQIASALSDGATYYWRVRSRDDELVWSDWSNTWMFEVHQIPGLSAEFRFGGGAVDTSGNENHGSVYGVSLTSDRFGNPSGACTFDGDDRIAGNSTNFPFGSSSRTIQAWIKTSVSAGNDRLIVHYGEVGGGAPKNFHLLLHSGTTLSMGNGYGYGTVKGNFLINDGQWHFVAGVYDSTANAVRLYVDGVQDGLGLLATVPNTLVGGNVYEIGVALDHLSLGFFVGSIDDIRIFNRALSELEIQTLYQEGGW